MKNYLWILFIGMSFSAFGQKEADTTKLVKTLKNIMSFSINPYVSFRTDISLEVEPSALLPDTNTHISTYFCKHLEDMYCGNDREETYLQDSLIIRVSHLRKTIQVGRVDMASKANINIMPLDNKKLNQLFRADYTITSDMPDDSTGRINLVPKIGPLGTPKSKEQSLSIFYNRQNNMMKQMDIHMRLVQPYTSQIEQQLVDKRINPMNLIIAVGDRKYISIDQTISFALSEVSQSPKSVMPLWQDILDYDATHHTFCGKGKCAGYEVTMTF